MPLFGSHRSIPSVSTHFSRCYTCSHSPLSRSQSLRTTWTSISYHRGLSPWRLRFLCLWLWRQLFLCRTWYSIRRIFRLIYSLLMKSTWKLRVRVVIIIRYHKHYSKWWIHYIWIPQTSNLTLWTKSTSCVRQMRTMMRIMTMMMSHWRELMSYLIACSRSRSIRVKSYY